MLRAMSKSAAVLEFPVPDPREVPEARRQVQAWEQTLTKIREDAREQARHYREDTVVPEGGE